MYRLAFSAGKVREDFFRERFDEWVRQVRCGRLRTDWFDDFEDLFLEVSADCLRVRRCIDGLEFIFLGQMVKLGQQVAW